MNKMKCLLAAVVALVVMAGCGKKVDVTLGASTLNFAAEGESVTVALTSNGDWTVDSYPEWLTVNPTSGKGDATLTLTASVNESEESRSGEMQVTTKDHSASLTVTQEPREASFFHLSPTEIEADATGGSYEVMVTANCDWTINNTADWIHCEPTSGHGNGIVTINIDPIETDVDDREANIVFVDTENNSMSVHVMQHSPLNVFINLTPSILVFEYTGGVGEVTVYSNSNWTVSCDASWVTLSATSGSGNGNLEVTVTENPTMLETRMTNIRFVIETGEAATLFIKQEGAPDPHFLEVTPTEFNFGKEGGTAEITVSCDTDWEAQLQSDWASLSQLTGNGNGTITLTVAPNTLAAIRSVDFKIVSGALSTDLFVHQEAGDELMTAFFEPDTLYPAYTGGIKHVDLYSNCTWQLDASSWITLFTTSGNGDASFDIVVDLNMNPEGRIGYVNARHDGEWIGSLVIVQEGKPNIFETDVTEIEARPEGGEYTIQLTANQSWTLDCDSEWMTCTPGSGPGNCAITVNVEALANPRPRTGHIKLVGSTGAQIIVTVNQNN